MFFKSGSYLRVTTPKTTNGIIPATVDGQVQTKETFLPLSAKKKIEAKNARLVRNGFKHLAAKVEVVNNTPAPPMQNEEMEKLRQELDQLRSERESKKVQEKPEKKEKPQTT